MADWELVEELYDFLKRRGNERAQEAQSAGDVDALRGAQSSVRMYQRLYADAARQPWTAAATIDYFREKAMRYHEHPDFRPEWTIKPR